MLIVNNLPTEGVETAKRVSPAFALFRNGLQERMLRSQNQNDKITPKRTETKENEELLSSIVIKIHAVIFCLPWRQSDFSGWL